VIVPAIAGAAARDMARDTTAQGLQLACQTSVANSLELHHIVRRELARLVALA